MLDVPQPRVAQEVSFLRLRFASHWAIWVVFVRIKSQLTPTVLPDAEIRWYLIPGVYTTALKEL